MTSNLLFFCSLFFVVGMPLAIDPVSLPDCEPPIEPAKLTWSALPELPNELGVAGPFVGVHNDALIVAGGANFRRPVWDNQKEWLDQIWVLSRSESAMTWRSGGKLRRALAYGAAVSTPNGIVCIGGNDKNQTYRDVFLLQWDPIKQQVASREYPPLPSPLAYGQATLVGGVIYVVGGQSGLQLASALNNFWSLDISHQNDAEKFRWQELQSLPTHPRAYNIVTHQRKGDRECVYVLGGRNQVDDQVRFLKDVWRFDPKTKSWQRCEDLPWSVTAGIGIGWGEREIYVLGGDDGSLFARTDELRDQHPGFRKEALAYDTLTNVWISAGATPQNQVTTIPVIWNNNVIVASGEVRPRVRTPAVWSIKIPAKK